MRSQRFLEGTELSTEVTEATEVFTEDVFKIFHIAIFFNILCIILCALCDLCAELCDLLRPLGPLRRRNPPVTYRNLRNLKNSYFSQVTFNSISNLTSFDTGLGVERIRVNRLRTTGFYLGV
ncbi:MAG: hypothetical protein WBZ29_15260, partial [Methanocella sp.]